MGRPGTSHSSHSSHSSHRSSSHGSSSHRISSSRSSRPGTSRSSSGYRSSGSTRNHYYYGGSSYGSYGSYSYYSGMGRSFHTVTTLITLMIFLIIFAVVAGHNVRVNSTIQRTKLTNVEAYTTDCIRDDAGWVESKSQAGKGMKSFYEKTGIQPYVYIKGYDSSLTSDMQKEQWAGDYFDSTYDSNDLLFIYFCEKSDNDVGLMHLVYGTDAATVMDSEACDIFWSYMDSNWQNDNLSMTDVFVNTFTSTGNAIMSVSKTGADVVVMAVWSIIIIVGLIAVVIVVKAVLKNKKEKRESDERILNTPVEHIDNVGTENLIDKYGGGSNGRS